MERFKSKDELLDFAIAREEEAVQFYNDLAKTMSSSAKSKVFESFAREEMGHKSKLTSIKEGKYSFPPAKKVEDLKIGDYLVTDEVKENMTYQEALILAMKKEKLAFKLYSDMAEIADSDDLRNVMLSLAQEEAKHKLRFEVEYDEQILGDN